MLIYYVGVGVEEIVKEFESFEDFVDCSVSLTNRQ